MSWKKDSSFEKKLQKYMNKEKAILGEVFPEIKRLNNSKVLEDLELEKQAYDESQVMVLSYNARGDPSIFPHVRQGLIDDGLAKGGKIRYYETYGRGDIDPKKQRRVRIGFYGSRLQVFLKVRK